MTKATGYVARGTAKCLSEMAHLRRWLYANRHNLFRHRLRYDFDQQRSRLRNLRRWHMKGMI